MIYSRKKPANYKAEDEKYFAAYFQRDTGPCDITIYSNIYINNDLILFKRTGFLDESFFLKNKLRLSRTAQRKYILSELIKNKRHNIEQAVWLSDIWSYNYFHWQVDFLQRYMILTEKNYQDRTLIIPEEYKKYEFITDALNILHCKTEYLEKNTIIKVRELVVPHFFWPPGTAHDELLSKIRQLITEKLNIKSRGKKKRIYIERNLASKRHVRNEKELISMLKTYGIESYKMEHLRWEEQVTLAYNSDLVIGLHGAGMSNILYMEQGKVIELRMSDSYDQWCYFELASALGHEYYYIFCEPADDNTDPYSGDVTADLSQIKQLLDQIQVHDHN